MTEQQKCGKLLTVVYKGCICEFIITFLQLYVGLNSFCKEKF